MKKIILAFVAGLIVTTTVFATTRNFPDVAQNDWFYPGVQYASSYGFMNGYPNGNFGPDDAVNRAQLATILKTMEVGNILDELRELRLFEVNKLVGSNWQTYKQNLRRFPVFGIQNYGGPGRGNVAYEDVQNILSVLGSAENGYYQILALSSVRTGEQTYFFVKENSDMEGELIYGPFFDDVRRVIASI